MIVTTVWGTPGARRQRRGFRPPRACRSSVSTVSGCAARLAGGPLRVRMTTRVRTGWMPIPHLVGRADRTGGRPLRPLLGPRRLLAPRRDGQRHGQRHDAGGGPPAGSRGAASSGAASASPSGRGTRTGATPARPGTPTTPGASCTSAASCISTWTRRARAAPPTTPCSTPPRTRSASRRAWWPTSPARPVVAGASRARAISPSGARACPRAFMSLGAAEAGHRALALDGTAGRQRGFPLVVAHEGRHDRQDRPRRSWSSTRRSTWPPRCAG